MSPDYVGPCAKAQKNDEREAEAIAEVATWPTMRSAALKSKTQQQSDRSVLVQIDHPVADGVTAEFDPTT